MKRIINRIQQRGGFFGAMLTLLSGNLAAQAIRVGFVAILTRLFTPEAFGQYSLVFSIIGVLVVVSHFRYNAAIMIPKDQETADALALLGYLLVTAFSIVLGVGVWLFQDPLAQATGLGKAMVMLYVIPVGVFLNGLEKVLSMAALRRKSFHKLSVAQIISALGSRITAVAGAFFVSTHALVLVLTTKLLNDLLIIVVTLYGDMRMYLGGVFSRDALRRLPAAAMEYRQFPLYAYSDLIIIVATDLPVYMLGMFFSPAVVGFYSVGKRVLNEPSIVIAEAISRTFLQFVAEKIHAGEDASEFVLKVVTVMMTLCALPAVILGIYAEPLFALVFGQKWAEAGTYMRFLLPIFIITFIHYPVFSLFDQFKRQADRLFFSVAQLVIGVVSLGLGAMTGNEYIALGLYSAGASLVLFWSMMFILRLANVSVSRLGKNGLYIGAYCVGAGIILLSIRGSQWFPWADIAASAALLAVYFLVFAKNFKRISPTS